MTAFVYEPTRHIDLDGLEHELARAFAVVRDALARNETVIVVVDDEDVQGAGDVPGAALAHGLVGLVRALAIEGRKPGWRINALALPRALPGHERQLWISRLAEPGSASGVLLRLGHEHLGKVPA